MKNKLPKELDPQEVFNTIFKQMWDCMEEGKNIAHDTSLSLEQRLKCIEHRDARISGMIDVLNALGYEIRDADGRLTTAKVSLFYERQMLVVEIARQRNKQ